MFGGILLIIAVGVLYEGLKTLRELLAGREAKKNANRKNVGDVNVLNSNSYTDKSHLLASQTKVGVK